VVKLKRRDGPQNGAWERESHQEEEEVLKEVLNSMENTEILLFKEFENTFDRDFTPEKKQWLREEFKKYIEKFRELFEFLQGKFSLNIFFDRIAGNGWMVIRREFINRAIEKKDNKKIMRGLV
jgi:hypothetical protein